MRNELGNTLGVTLPPVTLPSVSFSPVKRHLCLVLTGAWGRVNLQAPLSATVGV